jgi:hypothetical protein
VVKLSTLADHIGEIIQIFSLCFIVLSFIISVAKFLLWRSILVVGESSCIVGRVLACWEVEITIDGIKSLSRDLV